MPKEKAYLDRSSRTWTNQELKERLDEVCERLKKAQELGHRAYAGILQTVKTKLLQRERARQQSLKYGTMLSRGDTWDQ